MRTYHEQLLTEVFAERDRLMSRRRLMAGGAGLVAGAATLSLGGFMPTPALAQDEATPVDGMTFEDDLAVLNYALTLEHLENAFYRDCVPQFDFGLDGYSNDIGAFLAEIGAHEQAHVDTLVQVITDLGGTPVEEAAYDFGYTDAVTFQMTAAALENTGVRAYDGAGQFLEDPGLLTVAGSIVAVEARHASYLNLITGVSPFPEAFEDPATPDEVLEIAGPFIVS